MYIQTQTKKADQLQLGSRVISCNHPHEGIKIQGACFKSDLIMGTVVPGLCLQKQGPQLWLYELEI